MKEWDSEEALANLRMERAVNPEETNESLTREAFANAGPLAAQSIIHIALHSVNDRTRLTAAQYVVDRILGKAGTDLEMSGDSPLEAALRELNEYANTAANTGHTDHPDDVSGQDPPDVEA